MTRNRFEELPDFRDDGRSTAWTVQTHSGPPLGEEAVDDQGGAAITRPQAAIPETLPSRGHSPALIVMR
jgi:hypothetical protein